MESLKLYIKLFSYLEKKYFETKIDDLGLLLGDMRILDDGKSADPAILSDWNTICEKNANESELLYKNCIIFLEQYAIRLHSTELNNLIEQMKNDKMRFINEIVK